MSKSKPEQPASGQAPAQSGGQPQATAGAPARPAARPVSGEARMYLGPTRVGRVLLQQGTVYAGGVLPAQVKALADKSAELSALLVPVSRVAQAKAELRDPKSKLARAFQAVAKMEV